LLEKAMKNQNDNDKIAVVLSLYNKYKILEFAEEKKEIYLNLAYEHLFKVEVENSKKEVIINTAQVLMNRAS
jgi:hypothetical protein